MKRILVSTKVESDFDTVIKGFDSGLLAKLNPPFPRVKLLRYDGNQTGDEVHIELNFFIYRTVWISRITDFMHGSSEYTFVDEGVQLPFFLKSWRHRHSIITENGSTIIRDDIRYSSSGRFVELFMYLPLLLQFRYRRPVYRSVFRNRAG